MLGVENSHAQAKSMILFHNDHTTNVAVHLFSKPTCYRDGVAKLGESLSATCTATASGALVPQ
jgi:hypothetical protein